MAGLKGLVRAVVRGVQKEAREQERAIAKAKQETIREQKRLEREGEKEERLRIKAEEKERRERLKEDDARRIRDRLREAENLNDATEKAVEAINEFLRRAMKSRKEEPFGFLASAGSELVLEIPPELLVPEEKPKIKTSKVKVFGEEITVREVGGGPSPENLASWRKREESRKKKVRNLEQRFQKSVLEREQKKQSLRRARKRYADQDVECLPEYFDLALEGVGTPIFESVKRSLSWLVSEKALILNVRISPLDAIPKVERYRYIKSRDEIVNRKTPVSKVRRLSRTLLASIALRCLSRVFRADHNNFVETVYLNGCVKAVDRSKGSMSELCLVSISCKKAFFEELILSNVDAVECLTELGGKLSAKPDLFQVITRSGPSG